MKEQRPFETIFNALSSDQRITVWHFAVLMSLFNKWLTGGSVNPVTISRREIMLQTHISSIVTYHKCIRQLKEFGYIVYEPSYNPFTGSSFYLKIPGIII